jgi:hypothetical protein
LRQSRSGASFCLDSLLNKTQFADRLNIEELRLACNPSQFQTDLLKKIILFCPKCEKLTERFHKIFCFSEVDISNRPGTVNDEDQIGLEMRALATNRKSIRPLTG